MKKLILSICMMMFLVLGNAQAQDVPAASSGEIYDKVDTETIDAFAAMGANYLRKLNAAIKEGRSAKEIKDLLQEIANYLDLYDALIEDQDIGFRLIAGMTRYYDDWYF